MTLGQISHEIEVNTYPGLTSMIVSVDGELVLEAYGSGTDAATTHDIRSAAKSITSLLVGVLATSGTLPSLDTPVASIIPTVFATVAPEGGTDTGGHL